MPRPAAASYRLGDDTLVLIDRLSEHFRNPLGRSMSGADVVRLAVRRLAESEGLDGGEKKIPKKNATGH